jgi:2-polyprenyl-3-methyl-5-hydroxy-6-metoxy-1,4-benzoquinol methylase
MSCICPLCKERRKKSTEVIKTCLLVNLWRKRTFDVASLFRGVDEITKIYCQKCGLGFYDTKVAGDNEFYSKLANEKWYYLHEDKSEFTFTNALIQENDSVLDIGSGRGAFTKYIDKKIDYIGLELSSDAVEFAQSDNLNVIEKTIESYSEGKKNKHDLAVAFQVLEHIENIDSFIQSTREVLKPNGMLIIAVPNNDSFIKYAPNNLLNLPPHHLLHWNEQSLSYMAEKYDFEVVDVFKEKVTNVHRNWYYFILVNKYLMKLLGLRNKSLYENLFVKLLRKLSVLISLIFRFTNLHKNKNGHTIIIALRKCE